MLNAQACIEPFEVQCNIPTSSKHKTFFWEEKMTRSATQPIVGENRVLPLILCRRHTRPKTAFLSTKYVKEKENDMVYRDKNKATKTGNSPRRLGYVPELKDIKSGVSMKGYDNKELYTVKKYGKSLQWRPVSSQTAVSTNSRAAAPNYGNHLKILKRQLVAAKTLSAYIGLIDDFTHSHSPKTVKDEQSETTLDKIYEHLQKEIRATTPRSKAAHRRLALAEVKNL